MSNTAQALLDVLADNRTPQKQIDELRELLDLLGNFSDNDQRARFILNSNFMRDNGREIADRIRRTDRQMNVAAGRQGIVPALTASYAGDAR